MSGRGTAYSRSNRFDTGGDRRDPPRYNDDNRGRPPPSNDRNAPRFDGERGPRYDDYSRDRPRYGNDNEGRPPPSSYNRNATRDDYSRPPPGDNNRRGPPNYNDGAERPYGRNAARPDAETDSSSRYNDDAERRPPPSTRGRNAERPGGERNAPARSYDDDRRPPPSSYNQNDRRAYGRGEDSSRYERPPPASSYQRNDDRHAPPSSGQRRGRSPPPLDDSDNYSSRGGYRQGDNGRERYGRPPPSSRNDEYGSRDRGYGREQQYSRPNNGGYNERNQADGYNDRRYDDNRYSRDQGGYSSTRGGRSDAYNDRDSYRSGPRNSGYENEGYGQTPSRGSYGAPPRGSYNAAPPRGSYDSPSRGSYGGASTRGSYGASTRGSYGGGQSGYSGYSAYDSSQDRNGSSGYSGYGGYDQGSESAEKTRAPRDYRPKERNVEDIFSQDREEAGKNTATIFDADADVRVEETSTMLHCDTWEDMGLHENLMENIKKSGYLKPRKIQQTTIPYALADFDVKCQGETGSGKTAAFLIPVVQKLLELSEQAPLIKHAPYCLIISPTRELCNQIYNQCAKFCHNTPITYARVYGQIDMRANIRDVVRGCNILVGCLGRVLHYLNDGVFNLDNLKFFILDEADRLLLENSSYDVMRLVEWEGLKSGSFQTLLFSATLRDRQVMELSRKFIRADRSVMITAQFQSNRRVQYKVFPVPNPPAKYKYLIKYMKKITEENGGEVPRTLIFVNKKHNTDRVAVDCTSNGFSAITIHGDRGQNLREEALESFTSGATRCLVATDVCARGVDIPNMDHVINFDMPTSKDNFVQRCGRTGRVHNGVAMSLYLETDDRLVSRDVAAVIRENGQQVPGFLEDHVTEADYNFGEPVENVSNGLRNNAPENNQDDQRPAAPWHHSQSPTSSFTRRRSPSPVIHSRGSPAAHRSPSPITGPPPGFEQENQNIPDSTVDDDWQ